KKSVSSQDWIITRGPANPTGYHIQARTADQLNSFAAVSTKDQMSINRSKTADSKLDVFTLVVGLGQVTMNVIGKIKYVGDWKGIS
ncbi:MAG: hypothetical protein ACRER2_00890, partial [Methylococcales bacterium]